MNAIQDPTMIEKLYEASEAGVKVDMIVRGICCLIPGEAFSKNISVTRIVDSYLEHARLWHFHAGGKDILYMGSPDWMKRNLQRRIETVFPILDKNIKTQMLDFLQLELHDNVKGTSLNEELKDIPKIKEGAVIRSQYAMYDFWKEAD
jgi:polyphosphate kinase